MVQENSAAVPLNLAIAGTMMHSPEIRVVSADEAIAKTVNEAGSETMSVAPRRTGQPDVLCIGHHSHAEGLRTMSNTMGFLTCMGTWSTSQQAEVWNILEQHNFESLTRVMTSTCCQGLFATAPHKTFRLDLRDQSTKGIWGKERLDTKAKELVRAESLAWLRLAVLARICLQHNKPFLVSSEKAELDQCSLPEWARIVNETEVCRLDAKYFGGRQGMCITNCRLPLEKLGELRAGTMEAVACEYAMFMDVLIECAGARREMSRVGQWNNCLVRDGSKQMDMGSTEDLPTLDKRFNEKGRLQVTRDVYLRGTPAAVAQDHTVGGLRSSHLSVEKVPHMLVVGAKIAQAIEQERCCIENEQTAQGKLTITQQILQAMGNDVSAPISQEHLNRFRKAVAEVVKCTDSGPIDEDGVKTEICGHLLHAWAEEGRDPASQVATWTWRGSPAGLSEQFKELDSVFPTPKKPLETDWEQLNELDGSNVVYKGLETNQDVCKQVDEFIGQDFIREFVDYKSAWEFLGERPVLSKMGCVSKLRAGVLKHRLILDTLISGVSKAAARTHAVKLPRMIDLIFDSLELASDMEHWEELIYFVLDFCNAFWLLPLSKAERRYFTAVFRGKYLVWLRNAQGSRGAPTAWAAMAGLLMRCAMSVVGKDGSGRRMPYRCAGHCYVDDPIFAVRGTRRDQHRLIVRIVLAWMVLGLPLAFKKARIGNPVDWIGFQIHQQRDRVIGSIPKEKMQDLLEGTLSLMKGNVVAAKELRSYAGKLVNVSNLILQWRPFLEEIWAALSSHDQGTGDGASRAPPGCVWTVQISPALRWFKAFLEGRTGGITRVYTLQAYLRLGSKVEMVFDASPWGLGGFLTVNGIIIEYFMDEIQQCDLDIFKAEIGNHQFQQLWEVLATLVGLRLWQQFWMQKRVRLSMKSDNMTALECIATLKLKVGSPYALIARELALTFADGEYAPDICAHIPGVANEIADKLSRFVQPGKTFVLPHELKNAKRVPHPSRTQMWYRAISPS